MKKEIRYGLCMLNLVVFLASAVQGATVKKKSGEIVKGQIIGLIIHRGDIKTVQQESKITYKTTYDMINGREIVRIDEDGILKKGSHLVFLMVQQNEPINDETILAYIMKMPEGERVGTPPGGGTVIRMAGTSRFKEQLYYEHLLGELREENSKVSLIPAILVKTSTGNVKIPLDEIVEFKTKIEGKDH